MSAPSGGVKRLTAARFNALCYSRLPVASQMSRELEWWADAQERVIGIVLLDLTDDDYAWIVLGRDERGLFRAVDLGVSLETQETARSALQQALAKQAASGEVFPQQDNSGKRHEILRVQVADNKLHANFRIIISGKHHEAARRMMEEIALAFVDIDGNYAKDFQTTGFNARLWELALFAFLYEQKFSFLRDHNRPDFCVVKWGHPLAIEATTANPTVGEPPPHPVNQEEVDQLRANYMPMKFGSALYSKLQKKYWELEHLKDAPLIFAIHDFCADDSMTWSKPALSDYLYGVRATWKKSPDGKLEITENPITEHVWRDKRIPSGFFKLPGAEHVGAVLFSSAATVSKFNRMGVLAGFGRDDVIINRIGVRQDFDPNATEGIPFFEEVVPGVYEESWSDDFEVYHNPNARIPIPEDFFEGCAHHYFDGKRRVSYLPKNYIHGSLTNVIGITPDERTPESPTPAPE